MPIHRVFLAVFLTSSLSLAIGQSFERVQFPLKNKADLLLKNAWVGGLNAPQFSEADLNNDGKKDIVVFDRTGNRVLPFLNTATAADEVSYDFAPKFAKNFPETLRGWALLRDFNKDGAADLFASSNPTNAGVMVWRGYFENNELKFHFINFTVGSFPILYYKDLDSPNFLNLNISMEDVPEFVDVNGDGDLDCITFDPGGGWVEYFENEALELGLGLDTVLLKNLDRCWLKYYETGLTKASILSADGTECAHPFAGPEVVEDRDGLHVGSTNCAFDQDGDGDMDFVTGDISFNNMVFYKNCGDKTAGWACQQDSMFPIYDTPVNMTIFPAGFYFDVDNDGRKDFIAASNRSFAADDIKMAWRFKNVGTGATQLFNLQQKDFLVDEMADLGTGAHPAIVDMDGDGLLDLVVGNYGIYKGQGTWDPRLTYFHNIGTSTDPIFKLEDDDWLHFSQFTGFSNATSLAPAFGDLDGDGDLDLLVGAEDGTFFFVRNTQPLGFGEKLEMSADSITAFWNNIDIGTGATPIIADFDGDGLNDIVCGRRQGALSFIKNKNWHFGPSVDNNLLGSVTMPPGPAAESYNAPALVTYSTGESELFIGAAINSVYRYKNVLNKTASGDQFTLVDSDWGHFREGWRVHPALADFNKDGVLEVILGNSAGGLSFFSTNLKTDGSIVSAAELPTTIENELEIFPNPTTDRLTIRLPEIDDAPFQIFNSLGQKMVVGRFSNSEVLVDVSRFSSGIYIVEVAGRVKRFLKI